MQKLVDGLHKFKREAFSEDQKLFENLIDGQQPLALFITCSDSRIDPNRLTQTKPGELFIQRTAGNIIPPYGAVFAGEAATVEYAVSVLKIPNIIICGHSHCGAMTALMKPKSLKKLPAVKAHLSHAESTRRIIDENYQHVVDPAERLTITVEENVLVQLKNLETHPSVVAAISRGELKLHGWVYKFETGDVFSFDPSCNQFVPIREGEFVANDPEIKLPAI
ncbi:UNVERIFIED_CONTAM: hypothetical protein GTU68_022846 [Idotea baltica]|nr:hypothetical protein [Idotea baltica]